MSGLLSALTPGASSNLLNSAGRVTFQLAFQISPILLIGDSPLTRSVPGGILALLELGVAVGLLSSLTSGKLPTSLDDYPFHFQPLPGSTLIDNELGRYPLANQTVAANALIAQPTRVSMLMDWPVKGQGGYTLKLAAFLAMQAALILHNNAGGMYTILTPAFPFTPAVLLSLHDVTPTGDHQVQSRWQWDFECPLLTQQQAQAAQNTSMGRITGQLPSTGATVGSTLASGGPAGSTLSNVLQQLGLAPAPQTPLPQ